jgi:hypothetical protein
MNSKYAQVLLKVRPMAHANAIAGDVISISPVSDNFNMENYNKLVDLMHNSQLSNLFM